MSASKEIKVEYLPLDELRPDPFNPRTMSQDQLRALERSIEEFGFIDPIIVRRQDLTVIGGHQRLVAARRLGIDQVPVVQVDLSPDQARLLNLGLNRIGGEWDEVLLARLLQHLDAEEQDLSLSGFEEDEVSDLLRSLDRDEKRGRPETFDLDAALLEAKAGGRVSAGDVWLLGPHRLICGDATRSEDLAILLDGQKAQLAVTDPPYNVDYGASRGSGNRRRRIANDAMSPAQWEEFVRGWARNLLAAVDGALYVFMSCKEWPVVSSILEEMGGHWSTTIIWAKDRFVIGRSDYQRQYEPIWYGWRQGAPHAWHGGRSQGDVWQIERPASSQLHPTMKPIEVFERALQNSSRPGDTVLDLFLGSGTALIAAERTSHTCLAMEIDPVYCALAIARWEAFTGKTAKLAGKT